MKQKHSLLFVLLLCLLAFSACTKPPAPPEDTAAPASEAVTADSAAPKEAYAFDGAYLIYGGESYDPSPEQDGSMTVMDVTEAGNLLCVTCHVSPKNNFYAVFDPAEKAFVQSFAGTNLIWHSDDMTTAVYAFWSGIYTYDGAELAFLELPEGAWVDALAFSDDRKQVLVTVETPDGDSYTETVDLP